MLTAPGYVSPEIVRSQILDLETEKSEPTTKRDTKKLRMQADRMLATLFRHLPSAYVLMPDGHMHQVDNGFLNNVVSEAPFRHYIFDLPTGRVLAPAPGLGYASSKWAYFTASLILLYTTSPLLLLLWIGGGSFSEGLKFATDSGYHKNLILVEIVSAISIYFVYYSNYLARKSCGPCLGGYLLIQDDMAWSFLNYHYYKSFPTPQHENTQPGDGTAHQASDPEEMVAAEIIAMQDALPEGQKLLKKDAAAQLTDTAGGVNAFSRAWVKAVKMRPILAAGGRPKL